MDNPIPEELKFINQFIQRSKELNSQEPIISYYCLCYSVKLAISQGFKSQESRDYISTLFDLLEETKKTHSDNEAITSELAGIAYVENFALKVFQSADNQERGGNLSIKTVRAFMAAANFLEVLKYFDKELEGEILEKLKYSKFKAAEIAKLIKEGKVNREDGQRSPISQGDASENVNAENSASQHQNAQPTGQDSHPIDRLPSPPTVNNNINEISSFSPISPTFQSNDDDFSILPTPPSMPILPSTNSDIIDLPSIPTHHPSSAPQFPYHQSPSAPQSPYSQIPAPPPPSHASPVNHNPYNMNSMYDSLPASQPPKLLDPKLLSQTEKCCRFAISSLQYDDLEEALKQLDKARNLIIQLQQQKQ